jgi:gluconate 2-dehydrogenase gamma chain
MRKRITEEEFRELMEPWDPKMKAIAEQRMTTGYRRERLENFSESEAAIMRAAVDRLIPQAEGIDIVGFIDGRMWDALGRGDRQPGMPEELEVIRIGIAGLDEAASALFSQPFIELDREAQDEVLRKAQAGEVPGEAWQRVPSGYFFKRFYARALTGYFSHPRAWMRIGFYGSSYPEGYVWLGRGQVKQRHERAMGWERL